MVKRTSPNIKSETEALDEKETLAVVKYISQLLSNRISQKSDSLSNDDLIVSLSDKHENRRARQVFEWEKVRRQNAQRTA